MVAEDNAKRELDVLAAEQVALPTQTSVAVPTTAATNSTPYGFSQAQANDLVTTVNALVADVAALLAYIQTLETAAQ